MSRQWASARWALLCGCATVLILDPSAPAWAQNAPPASQETASTPSTDDQKEIVIVAEAPEHSSIDRTTYTVRDNAESRSANTLDLLRQVPLVSVTAQDDVQLMGVSGVKILVDGKEIADSKSFLRNLQGSQVAKIEVMTNPSAAFSASGTGGIINIILRHNFAPGLRGSVTGNAGNFGDQELKLSPTWTHGRLSLSGSLDLSHSDSHSDVSQDRFRIDAGSNPVPVSSEARTNRSEGNFITGNFLASYKLTPKQTISASASASSGAFDGWGLSSITLDGPPAEFERQPSTSRDASHSADFSLDYRKEGSHPEEALTASAKWSDWRARTDGRFETDTFDSAGAAIGSSAFLNHSSIADVEGSLKLDYVRPWSDRRRVSLGASLDFDHVDQSTDQSGDLGGGQAIAASTNVRGSYVEAAAYATYQFPLPVVTALAGLRVENRGYHFAGASVPLPDRTHLFPSLHLERKLSKRVTADLSYSRRIGWPGFSQLDPILIFSDPLTAAGGNPLLRPQLTDSYEGTLKIRLRKHSIDLVFYDRRTHDDFSRESDLQSDGVLVTRPVNLGWQRLRGASLAMQGDFGGGFHYSLNGNIADETFGPGSFAFNAAGIGPQYNGHAQFEYRRGKDDRRGADHLTFDLYYYGPREDPLVRRSAIVLASGSWSHTFTDRLSGLIKFQQLNEFTFRSTSYSETAVSRSVSRVPGPRFVVSLTYSLAAPR